MSPAPQDGQDRSGGRADSGGDMQVDRHVDLGEIVDRLAADDVGGAERGRLLARLTGALAAGLRAAGGRAVLTGRYLSDVVTDLAPHVPVRDLDTLREHFGGRTGEELADALVASATRVTAGVGAAGGTLAAAQLAAPPTLLATPLQVAAETVAVVAVELKLVAELHVAYGRQALGPPSQQAAAYLQAWVGKRGLDVTGELPGVSAVVATAARQQLRARLIRRFGRNATTLAPFLAGALAGAELNRRETRALGDAMRQDLRR